MLIVVFVGVALSLGSTSAELQCQPINDTFPLFDRLIKCGYSSTARFKDTNALTTSFYQLVQFKNYLKNCSAFVDVMGCSVFMPRCSEDIKGPYLPCRGVCDEWANACKDALEKSGWEWTAALCAILPEKDDPQTTKGYRGRCFTPPGYKSSNKTYKHHCAEILSPSCRGIPGFTQTTVSETTQRRQRGFLEIAINASFISGSQCGPLQREVICTSYLRPCVDGEPATLCRDKCLNYYNACKASQPLINKDTCLKFPKRRATPVDKDICKAIHWPLANNWHLPEEPPTVITPTSAREADNSTTVTSSTQTTEAATESGTSDSKGGKVSGGAVAGIVLGVLAALIISTANTSLFLS